MFLMFLAEGFEETEAITPLDMLRRAGADIKTVSITKNREVTGSHGITVTADCTLQTVPNEPVEMVILPGGMPGAKNLYACEEVKNVVVNTYNAGGFVAAICAAPFILGQLGLLNGKKATCYPGFEEQLTGAKITGRGAVRDGNIITAAGMGVAAEFGYELIKAVKGKQEADKVVNSILKVIR